MEATEIYDKLSQRDYSDNEADRYAQTLQTVFFHCNMSGQKQEFFKLLEKAELENKKISAPDDAEEYSIETILLI